MVVVVGAPVPRAEVERAARDMTEVGPLAEDFLAQAVAAAVEVPVKRVKTALELALAVPVVTVFCRP